MGDALPCPVCAPLVQLGTDRVIRPPRRRGGRPYAIPADRTAEVVALYVDQQRTLVQIAKDLGYARCTVQQRLVAAGVTIRPKFAVPGEAASLDWEADAVRLYVDDRLTLRQIAKTIHRKPSRVSAALKRAGVMLRGPGGAPSAGAPADVPAMVEMYTTQGLSARQIAAATGWGAESVRKWLVKAGVAMRANGYQNVGRNVVKGRRPLNLAPPAWHAEAVRLYVDENLSVSEVAAAVGRVRTSVCNALQSAGVRMRQAKPAPLNGRLAEAIELYTTREWTFKQIGEHVGIAASNVRERLVAAGVKPRACSHHRQERAADRRQTVEQQAVASYRAGNGIFAVARECKLTAGDVERILSAAGVERREGPDVNEAAFTGPARPRQERTKKPEWRKPSRYMGVRWIPNGGAWQTRVHLGPTTKTGAQINLGLFTAKDDAWGGSRDGAERAAGIAGREFRKRLQPGKTPWEVVQALKAEGLVPRRLLPQWVIRLPGGRYAAKVIKPKKGIRIELGPFDTPEAAHQAMAARLGKPAIWVVPFGSVG